MNRQLDTQVISLALKGKLNMTIEGDSISSIVANEFLLGQSNNYSQGNYYIPVLSKSHRYTYFHPSGIRNDHMFSQRSSDSILMDFGNEFPAILEYNSLSMSNVINERRDGLFNAAIKHLDKKKRKTLKKRIQFLLENKVRCIPLNQEIVNISFALLHDFQKQHNLKADFRNSWNDILILSSAINNCDELITEDCELAKFAANMYEVNSKRNSGFLEICFSELTNTDEKYTPTDSKGYINRGWRVQFNIADKINPKQKPI